MDQTDWERVADEKQRVINALGSIIQQLADQVIEDNPHRPEVVHAVNERLDCVEVFLTSGLPGPV